MMAQQFKALAIFPGDLGSILSTYVAAYNSSFGGSEAVFWHLWVIRHTYGARENTNTHKIKIQFEQAAVPEFLGELLCNV